MQTIFVTIGFFLGYLTASTASSYSIVHMVLHVTALTDNPINARVPSNLIDNWMMDSV